HGTYKVNGTQNITIVPFKTAYQEEAKRLILAGLEEHWGSLDPSRNPDLEDIRSSYSNGLFLVAILDEEVIGTGAILPRDNNTAEIVRMSVAARKRRKGIGNMILKKLCDHARSICCGQVVLETTDSWLEVIAFYERYGFQISHHQDGDVYFALDL
ncbi:GNAT family N-acetyltransferase, partial [Chloroflexota bacterium]